MKAEGEAEPASARWARRAAAVWRMRPGAHLATLAGLGLLALLLTVSGPPRYPARPAPGAGAPPARLAPGMGAQPTRPALPTYRVPPATGTPIPVLTAVVGTTATAGYSVEGLRATAEAVERILPTASPNPSLAVGKAERFQSTDIWRRAYGTATALYPPPLGYHPADLFTPIVDLTPVPTEPIRTAGAGVIYDDGWSTLFGKQMHIVNKWWETVGTRMTIVCAGGTFPPEDTLQGKVLAAIEDTTTHAVVSGPDFYLTPSRHGLVRVIDAVGERLTLRAADGTLFYFDVPSRQWVAPPPGPSPTP